MTKIKFKQSTISNNIKTLNTKQTITYGNPAPDFLVAIIPVKRENIETWRGKPFELFHGTKIQGALSFGICEYLWTNNTGICEYLEHLWTNNTP